MIIIFGTNLCKLLSYIEEVLIRLALLLRGIGSKFLILLETKILFKLKAIADAKLDLIMMDLVKTSQIRYPTLLIQHTKSCKADS